MLVPQSYSLDLESRAILDRPPQIYFVAKDQFDAFP